MTAEVPPGDPGAGIAASGELRASHGDRDGVVEQLRVAAGDGRLTAAELDQRLELALSARTYRELAVLLADLPPAAGTGGLSLPGPAAAQPRELIRFQCGSGHARQDGPWTIPRSIEVDVASGSVRLDFTEAVITSRILRIEASVDSGQLLLVTRPGILVHAEDVTADSGHVQTAAPWGPQVPEILRIEISGRVRSGSITARPPQRTFWQRLRRAPKPYQASLR